MRANGEKKGRWTWAGAISVHYKLALIRISWGEAFEPISRVLNRNLSFTICSYSFEFLPTNISLFALHLDHHLVCGPKNASFASLFLNYSSRCMNFQSFTLDHTAPATLLLHLPTLLSTKAIASWSRSLHRLVRSPPLLLLKADTPPSPPFPGKFPFSSGAATNFQKHKVPKRSLQLHRIWRDTAIPPTPRRFLALPFAGSISVWRLFIPQFNSSVVAEAHRRTPRVLGRGVFFPQPVQSIYHSSAVRAPRK